MTRSKKNKSSSMGKTIPLTSAPPASAIGGGRRRGRRTRNDPPSGFSLPVASAPSVAGYQVPPTTYAFSAVSHRRSRAPGLLIKVNMEPWFTVGANATFTSGSSWMYDRAGSFKAVASIDPTDVHYGRASEWIAAAFSRYRYRKFMITFVPCNVAGTSTVSIGMVGSADAVSTTITTASLLAEYAGGMISAPVWQALNYSVDMSLDEDVLYYVRNQGSTAADLRQSSQGAFVAANPSTNSVNPGGQFGMLYASFELELYDMHPTYYNGPTSFVELRSDKELEAKMRSQPVEPVRRDDNKGDPSDDAVYSVVDANTGIIREYISLAHPTTDADAEFVPVQSHSGPTEDSHQEPRQGYFSPPPSARSAAMSSRATAGLGREASPRL